MYTDILLHPLTRAAVVGVFIGYLIVSVYGLTHLQLGMRASDLLSSGSVAERALQLQDKYLTG